MLWSRSEKMRKTATEAGVEGKNKEEEGWELWEGVTDGDGVGSWGRGQGSIYLTGGGGHRAVIVPDSPSDPEQEARGWSIHEEETGSSTSGIPLGKSTWFKTELSQVLGAQVSGSQLCLSLLKLREPALGPWGATPPSWAEGSGRTQQWHVFRAGLVIPPLSSPVCPPAIRGARSRLARGETEPCPYAAVHGGEWTETRTGS